MDPITLIADQVREAIRAQEIDPARDGDSVRRLVESAVRQYEERAASGRLPSPPTEAESIRRVAAEIVGYGALQQYFDDPTVEEIWINEPGKVFVARRGVAELTTTVLTSAQIAALVERMLSLTGRRIDLGSPFVDAHLPDGSRLHVAIPDITRRHYAVNIRKFVIRAADLATLVRLGTIPTAAAEFLTAAVVGGLNVLVSGATQSGKTTLLNCLLAAVPARERVITCEEVFELRPPCRDLVALQCRPPGLDGTGRIDLRRLVVEALRMRPDRLVIGEVRQAESLDLSKWQRVNTGLNIRERRKRPSSRPDQGACVKVPRRFRPRELRRGRVSLAGAPGRARLAQWLCPMSACGGHCGMARVVAAACRRGRALVGWCLRGSWWPRAVAAAALPRPLLDGV
jgi:pilus assembly protein CpaF